MSLAHEVGHGADDVLDGDGEVHAVLVKQVDGVGGDAAKQALDGLAPRLGCTAAGPWRSL
ncbi:hypothetical protein WME81_35520 [Sorangium sp. So ce1078]